MSAVGAFSDEQKKVRERKKFGPGVEETSIQVGIKNVAFSKQLQLDLGAHP